MSCPHVAQAWSEEPPALVAHVAGCAECQRAQAAWRALSPPPEPPVSPLALLALGAAARAELGHAPARWWVGALSLLALNLAVALSAAALLPWSTVQHHSTALRWAAAAVWLTVTAAGVLLALAPRGRRWWWAVGALTAAGLASTALGVSGLAPGGPFLGGAGCAGLELSAALLPLVLCLWQLTRFAQDLGRALLGGLAAGCGGLLAVHLHCPNGSLLHVVTFHLLPVGLLALATWLARRALPSSSYAP